MKYCWLLWFYALAGFAQVDFDPFDDGSIVLDYDQPYLSLHATDVPIAMLLERVAKETGTNIIVQGDLSEKATLHLNHVPSEGVLLALCDTFHLQSSKREGFIWVGSPKEGGEPQETRVFPIRYGEAKSLKKVFENQHGVLSNTGSVRTDERTNALIITDDALHLSSAEKLLKSLDVPVKQVFIQARILNASKGFSKALGVSLSAEHDAAYASFQGRSPAGDFGQFQITLARLAGNIALDTQISAAEKNNETEVIAMPKILTADQQKATIKQGKELAYEETSASGATSLRFKEAVLELSVTPHITPDLDIILDLNVKHDVMGKLAENGQPTIDTQSIDTQVRLHDGETIVLGGIYSNTRLNQRQDVPFLSKIPLIGLLFRDRYREDDKNELLVFVTPTVVSE
ncbi:MAG: secretin N-terminal domain-containing protein [Gammaproteobacteria bacterium]